MQVIVEHTRREPVITCTDWIFLKISDKLARWNVLGLQSSLLSLLIHPVYLDGIIVNQMFDQAALQRALFGRLSGLPGKQLIFFWVICVISCLTFGIQI